jgi:hypothetical protein
MFAAGLAVGLALAGLLSSLWPVLGLLLLGASVLSLVLGLASARLARRAHLARGERGWGALVAYVVHALASLVVFASLLGGGVLGALVTFGPPLPPPSHASRSSPSFEARAPELLAVAGIVGTVYVLHALSEADGHDADTLPASASRADASASRADASASRADASASQADASASARDAGGDDFPFGAVVLGAFGVVGVAEYVWAHREEAAWVAGILGLVAVAAALEPEAPAPSPAAP